MASVSALATSASSAVDVEQSEFLTFFMDGEEYGVEILCVQEIRGWEPCTAIPNAPVFLKGVLNLRGTVVPVVDLRARFGIERCLYDATTVVIIVKVKRPDGGRNRTMGIVVDAVSDVHVFSASDIKSAPEVAGKINPSFVRGLGTTEKKMVILLNIHALMNHGLMN